MLVVGYVRLASVLSPYVCMECVLAGQVRSGQARLLSSNTLSGVCLCGQDVGALARICRSVLAKSLDKCVLLSLFG